MRPPNHPGEDFFGLRLIPLSTWPLSAPTTSADCLLSMNSSSRCLSRLTLYCHDVLTRFSGADTLAKSD